jgi:hypothetical protein
MCRALIIYAINSCPMNEVCWNEGLNLTTQFCMAKPKNTPQSCTESTAIRPGFRSPHHRTSGLAREPQPRDVEPVSSLRRKQRGQNRTSLFGQHQLWRGVAVHQSPDQQVLDCDSRHARLQPIGPGGETEQQDPFRYAETGRDGVNGGCFGQSVVLSIRVSVWSIDVTE